MLAAADGLADGLGHLDLARAFGTADGLHRMGEEFEDAGEVCTGWHSVTP
ncbi:hypothetical protein GCM10023192_25400 [Amycolatopsis samaneae]